MSLSRFLVKKTSEQKLKYFSLEELKKQIRDLAREWFTQRKHNITHIKNNYEEVTGNDFQTNKKLVLNGICDHYAEKIFGYDYDLEKYISFIKSIQVRSADIDTLHKVISRQNKVPLLFGGHFSGNEFFPVFMGNQKIPFSIIMRFKSEQGRKLAEKRLPRIGIDVRLCSVDDGLMKEIINIKKQKRLVYTVVDSFDAWKPDLDAPRINICGWQIYPDTVIEKMIKLLDAEVFWATFIRSGYDQYRFCLQKIKPDSDNRYIKPLLKKWEQHLLANPGLYYAWEDIHELKNFR
ncbi:MAG TPA: hypothetical protein VKS21_06640 [Spirochaetota bacterium]|nr:hypothetical protein [Spirochaetota bacterium]